MLVRSWHGGGVGVDLRAGSRPFVRAGTRLCSPDLVLERITPGCRVAPTHLFPQLKQLDLVIVLHPAIFVAEQLISLLHLLELILLDGLQSGVLHLIWMALEDELSVRAPDLWQFGLLRDSK
jgi:hypothetical protein